MKLPVSIIIPTLNEEKALTHLLQSLEKQTIQPKEIIIADAFSVDNTRTIAKDFHCTLVNGGLPGKGRNEGVKAATQDILLFLDADVILPSRFLEKTVFEMVEKDLDIATCFVKPQSTKSQDKFIASLWNYYFSITKNVYPHACGFCIFIKRDIHEWIRGFDETILVAEDIDYVRRASKLGKFGYLKSQKIPISMRRFHKNGRMKSFLQYLSIELHTLFIGNVRKNIFDYEFGKHHEIRKK